MRAPSLQPLLSTDMLHAYVHLQNGSFSMQIYVRILINTSYMFMAVTHFNDFRPSEEQNKCKGKYYPDAHFITNRLQKQSAISRLLQRKGATSLP